MESRLIIDPHVITRFRERMAWDRGWVFNTQKTCMSMVYSLSDSAIRGIIREDVRRGTRVPNFRVFYNEKHGDRFGETMDVVRFDDRGYLIRKNGTRRIVVTVVRARADQLAQLGINPKTFGIRLSSTTLRQLRGEPFAEGLAVYQLQDLVRGICQTGVQLDPAWVTANQSFPVRDGRNVFVGSVPGHSGNSIRTALVILHPDRLLNTLVAYRVLDRPFVYDEWKDCSIHAGYFGTLGTIWDLPIGEDTAEVGMGLGDTAETS